jgi:hypothetical protein
MIATIRCFFGRLQEHVLEKYPNPERIGCIDHATLETWVYSPEKLDLSDPKYLHVLKCAACTRELIELRKRRNEQRGQVGVPGVRPSTKGSPDWRWAGIAAVLVCGLALAGVAYWRVHAPASTSQSITATPMAETIDLSQAVRLGAKLQPCPPSPFREALSPRMFCFLISARLENILFRSLQSAAMRIRFQGKQSPVRMESIVI